MTHKNISEEERESSYNGKKLIFPVMLLRTLPCERMIGMKRKLTLEGLLEDFRCWEKYHQFGVEKER